MDPLVLHLPAGRPADFYAQAENFFARAVLPPRRIRVVIDEAAAEGAAEGGGAGNVSMYKHFESMLQSVVAAAAADTDTDDDDASDDASGSDAAERDHAGNAYLAPSAGDDSDASTVEDEEEDEEEEDDDEEGVGGGGGVGIGVGVGKEEEYAAMAALMPGTSAGYWAQHPDRAWF